MNFNIESMVPSNERIVYTTEYPTKILVSQYRIIICPMSGGAGGVFVIWLNSLSSLFLFKSNHRIDGDSENEFMTEVDYYYCDDKDDRCLEIRVDLCNGNSVAILFDSSNMEELKKLYSAMVSVWPNNSTFKSIHFKVAD